MATVPACSVVDRRSTGIRLGVRVNLFSSTAGCECPRNMARGYPKLDLPLLVRVVVGRGEGIEEMLDTNRCHETTLVQLHPIPFPGIKTLKGLILRPYGPENVARQVSAIHCTPKDISWLIGFLSCLHGIRQYNHLFLLAAAWVDPGRSALQSAEQWCR